MTDQMQDQQQQEEPEHIARLREKADKASDLERENAFLRAGVNLESTTGSLFAGRYTGKLDPSEISTAFAEFRTSLAAEFAPPATPPVEGQESAEDREARIQQEAEQHQQDEVRRGLTSTPGDPTLQDQGSPVARGFDQFHQSRRDGVERDKAAKPVIQALIEDAEQGGERRWNGWTEDQLAGDAPVVPGV